jgi:hypothetical protein
MPCVPVLPGLANLVAADSLCNSSRLPRSAGPDRVTADHDTTEPVPVDAARLLDEPYRGRRDSWRAKSPRDEREAIAWLAALRGLALGEVGVKSA